MVESGAIQQGSVDGTTLALEGIRVYFQSQRAGLDAQLVTRLSTFLDDAHDSIDCAIYDLRHPRILDALTHAVARGVKVRIAYDAGKEHSGGMSADPSPGGTEVALAKAGLLPHATAIHERGRHLMHDKFVVRDGRDIWVGSANFTEGGLELQDNTCLAISSRDLVAYFAAAFSALLEPRHRNTRSAAAPSSADPTGVMVGSTSITPFFAPTAGESIEQELISAIRGAQKIRLMAFLLSDSGILEALAPLAQQPHFDIRGVYDPHGMQDVLRYTTLDRALFWFMHDPRFVAAPSHAFSAQHEQDFMHNKTLVLDDRLVFTGSYNFSENAEANNEVELKIISEPLAEAYAHYSDVLFTAYSGIQQRNERATGAGAPPAAVPGSVAALEETPASNSRRASRRALDVLIFAIRLGIVAVVVALIAYLVLAGILHY
jgi:phosphatidylserine/phosphatidylglycerophosphate/cardiolipin synthase-like enzyme